MTTNPASGDADPTARESSVRTVILRHKLASAGAIALLLVLVAVMAATALVNSSGPLSDSSSCSEWNSASQAQKNTYSQLYINEYRALPSGARDADSVESAIKKACIQAAYLGESDDVSVVAALNHAY